MNLQILQWTELSDEQRQAALARPSAARDHERLAIVREIVRSVQKSGDEALRRLTKQFDGVELLDFRVSESELAAASASIPAAVDRAMRRAAEQIQRFHHAQLPKSIVVDVSPGICCEKRYLPLERVGLYAPAGSAPLPSTVLMLAVPAAVAGVKDRVIVTPPRRDGSADPGILHAAQIAGATAIYKIGGAQAIAALAFGTATVPRVDKIFGPGNAYVTAAKLLVAETGVPCDLPAGPSEVLVIAAPTADPEIVAADLLSQAEHDADSDVVCITTDLALAKKVSAELARQLQELPRRNIAERSMASARMIIAPQLQEAVAIANLYAPEHLIINAEPNIARQLADDVRHAGSVFLGPWSPEAAGDYATGTNHVLPTAGWARSYSGVGVETFMKAISLQEMTVEGLHDIGDTVEILAELEGLTAHRDAVRRRRAKLRELRDGG